MKRKEKNLQTSANQIERAFFVLLVLSALVLLGIVLNLVVVLAKPAGYIEYHGTAGDWLLISGEFGYSVRDAAYFPPHDLTPGAYRSAYLIGVFAQGMGMVFYGIIFYLGMLFFSAAQTSPFTKSAAKKIRWIALFYFLSQILPSLFKTVFYSIFAGGKWLFFPEGIPFHALLMWGILFAVANIFDYGFSLQNEADHTV